jgi:hypothetical protein
LTAQCLEGRITNENARQMWRSDVIFVAVASAAFDGRIRRF